MRRIFLRQIQTLNACKIRVKSSKQWIAVPSRRCLSMNQHTKDPKSTPHLKKAAHLCRVPGPFIAILELMYRLIQKKMKNFRASGPKKE